jgi:hypothetical protein
MYRFTEIVHVLRPDRKSTRTLENLEAGDIKLSDADLAETHKIVAGNETKGDRYYGLSDKEMHLWQ